MVKRQRSNANELQIESESERKNKKQKIVKIAVDPIDSNWISASMTRNFALNDTLVDWLDLYGLQRGFVPDNAMSVNSQSNLNLNFAIGLNGKSSQEQNRNLKKRKLVKSKNNGAKIVQKPRPNRLHIKTNFKQTNSKLQPCLQIVKPTGSPVLAPTSTSDSNSLSFKTFIMKQGNDFEAMLVEELKAKYKENVAEVQRNNTTHQEQWNLTEELMDKKTPIILQPFLFDNSTQTFGYPDLMVRNDWLHKIVNTFEEGSESRPKYSKKYSIVDIKFATMHLHANKRTMSNTGSTSAFKVQLCFYNELLSKIQKYKPEFAYVIGRGWSIANKDCVGSSNSWDRYGYIECNQQLKQQTNEAVKWLKNVRNHGHSWQVLPKASRSELMPNMCCTSDSNWQKTKYKIAQQTKDITLIWQCGITHRTNAYANGISQWDDPRCNAKELGIYGPKLAPVVDKILKINQSPDQMVDVISKDLKKEFATDSIELYVDFETVSSIGNIETSANQSYIFMIGVGHQVDGAWVFKNFTIDRLNSGCEKAMLIQFLSFVDSFKKPVRIYHYSHAEPTTLKYAMNKHKITFNKNASWFDLLKIVKDRQLVMKGCFNFSLKSITKGLYDLGMSTVSYDSVDNSIENGISAMVAGFQAEDICSKTNQTFGQIQLIKDVAKYNEIDCVSLLSLQRCLESLST